MAEIASSTNNEEILNSVISALGDNYKETDKSVVKSYIEDYLLIASNVSHRKTDDKLLIPYIKKAVVSAYLYRGKEGSSSNSEGGLSDNYVDIEAKLKKDVLAIRVIK